MKPQDILFLIVFALLVLFRKPKLLVWFGLICLVLSIPLFSFWIFFTAQRLVYYSMAFFAAASFILLFKKK